MQVIESKNLVKKYGSKRALDNFNLELDEGKIVGLIGRNGAGKTTFLKTCAGYIRPDEGEIRIRGKKVFDNIDVLSDIVFIDEELQFDVSANLSDILAAGRDYYVNWDDGFSKKLLKHFELNPKAKYKKLSRGMKTQFNIIMGICARAPLTLLDEPTLGLDAAIRKEFYSILIRDFMERPRTIIVSSHLVSEIEGILEEIILIKEGTSLLHKSVDEIKDYAVYLNGKKDDVELFISNRIVLNKEIMGNSAIYAIKNDISDRDKAFLAEKNIEVSGVSVQDACIYLTKNDAKEDVSYVF